MTPLEWLALLVVALCMGWVAVYVAQLVPLPDDGPASPPPPDAPEPSPWVDPLPASKMPFAGPELERMLQRGDWDTAMARLLADTRADA